MTKSASRLGGVGKVVYVVRHCKAQSQEAAAPLTPEGQSQAAALAEVLGPLAIDRVVSSPFERARRSVEPLARRLGLPIETDPRLRERVLTTAAIADWRAALRRSFDDLDLRLAGGESSRAAMARAAAVLADVLAYGAAATVLVTHGNLMALLLKHVDERLGFAEWEQLTNPDVFRLVVTEDGTQVERIWP